MAASCAIAQTAPIDRDIDIRMVSAIKDEGLRRSQVLTLARSLTDEVGPRLTGSPQFDIATIWATKTLTAAGVSDAHAESWGDFGLSWTQLHTQLHLLGRLPATFVAQATPWSPSTKGDIEAELVLVPVLNDDKQFDAYRGKLAGKIVLYGAPPAIDPDPKPQMRELTAERLRRYEAYPIDFDSNRDENIAYVRAARFNGRVDKFFASENAVAVLRTNGSGKVFSVDDGMAMGFDVYHPERRQVLPSAVMDADGYGLLARLVERGAPVSVGLGIATHFEPQSGTGYNVIGTIAGSDARLRRQVVMVGAHLDSWHTATGATDDGAGVVIAVEALRILNAVSSKPRRTIRIALWGGEEQGELGSQAYVSKHIATVTARGAPNDVPNGLRPVLSYDRLPGYADLTAYINLDGGGGRMLGLRTSGNDGAARAFRRWFEPLADLGVNIVSPSHAQGVDRESFSSVGVPSFDVVHAPRDYDSQTHHTNLDTYERLSEPDLKQAATALAVILYEIANADDVLPRTR